MVYLQDVALSSVASMFYQSGLVNEALLVTVLALDEVPDVVALHFMLANLYATRVTDLVAIFAACLGLFSYIPNNSIIRFVIITVIYTYGMNEDVSCRRTAISR